MNTYEFSRPVTIDALKPGARPRFGAATAEEYPALAERLHVPALKALSYDFDCDVYDGGRGVVVSGTVTGTVTLTCVVTLDEFDIELSDDVHITFHRNADAMVEEALKGVDDPDADLLDGLPEPLEGLSLDLGEVATQQFALVLPAYPRKPGVAYENPAGAAADEDEKPESPFAVLKGLKKGD